MCRSYAESFTRSGRVVEAGEGCRSSLLAMKMPGNAQRAGQRGCGPIRVTLRRRLIEHGKNTLLVRWAVLRRRATRTSLVQASQAIARIAHAPLRHRAHGVSPGYRSRVPIPSAARSTIPARNRIRAPLFVERLSASSTARSSIESVITVAQGTSLHPNLSLSKRIGWGYSSELSGSPERRPRSEWPISSATSNALSSCARSPSHDRLVVRQSDPFTAIPIPIKLNQQPVSANLRHEENNSLIELSSLNHDSLSTDSGYDRWRK